MNIKELLAYFIDGTELKQSEFYFLSEANLIKKQSTHAWVLTDLGVNMLKENT